MNRIAAVLLLSILSLPAFASILTYVNQSADADRRLTLRADGDRVLLVDDRSHAVVASAVAPERVIVRGAPGAHDDALTIDLANKLSVPGGIKFDGGAGGWDTLIITGGAVARESVTQRSPHDGVFDLDGLRVQYTNLEPLTDNSAAASLTVNGTAGADTVTISDGPGAGQATISSPTFESYTFANKTNVVFDGQGGGDSVTLNNPTNPSGLASFTIQNVGTVTQAATIPYPSFGFTATGTVSGDATYSTAGALTIGGLHATLGVTLTASKVTINGPVSANGGLAVRITTNRLIIGAGAAITAANGPVHLISSSVPIDLGSTTDAASALEISDAEIDRITTTELFIESAAGTNITFTQPITSTTELLIFLSGGIFTNGGAGSIAAPELIFGDLGSTGRAWTITGTSITENPGAPIPYSGATNIIAEGGSGSDIFHVTPSATTIIGIDANPPTLPATPGDTLSVDTAGTLAPFLDESFSGLGYSGSYSFGNRKKVTFDEIESLDAATDLAVTKSDGSTTTSRGASITYTITATNAGPLGVGHARVTDVFPVELTNVSWSCSGSSGATCIGTSSGTQPLSQFVDLPIGGVITIMVHATVDPSASGTVTNTAAVTPPSGVNDANASNNSATDVDTIAVVADVSITKRAAQEAYTPGGAIAYTIAVSNLGPGVAAGVTMTDPLPSDTTFTTITSSPPGFSCTTPAAGTNGTVTCTAASLAAGAHATFTLVVNVNGDATASISNSASVTSSSVDPNGANGTATVSLDAQTPGRRRAARH